MHRYHGFRLSLVLFVLFNIFTFVSLYFYNAEHYNALERYNSALIFGAIITSILCAISLVIIIKHLGDQYLFLIVSMLISMGCVIIYRLEYALLVKQILWVVIGSFLFLCTYFIYERYSHLFKYWSKYYFLVAFMLFVATLVFAEKRNGARNWIDIGDYSFQPSELIKIIFIAFLSSYTYFVAENFQFDLEKLGFKRTLKVPRMVVVTLLAYVFIGFLVLQKEWGTALEFFIIFSIMVYVFENNYYVILSNGILAIVGSIGGYFLTDHIKVRIDTWLDPWADIHGKGHQIIQSLFAIASGDFFGTGIGLGNPGLIPNVETDFIFSAICEEMGILGGYAVIVLYFLLVYRGIKIAISIKDVFHKRMAFGITVLFGIQTFIIIGGVIKMIPLTGVTLPFISYGGSSLTISFISLGILQAVSNRARVLS